MPGRRHLGDRAPYTAVINLSLLTAHHWRTVRYRLLAEGIDNPMGLPSLHYLLDATEAIILESFVSNKPQKDKADRENFLDSLYRPMPELLRVEGDGYKPPPAGFEEGGDDAWNWSMAGAEG